MLYQDGFFIIMNSNKYFVSVAGNIGSGKSSLTRLISEKLNWIPYFESVSDNPYLEDFYSDMLRWSFNLQIYFLSHRFRIHKEILEQEKSVIQDRSIYEDVEIFAKNLHEIEMMEKRDYENYQNLFRDMTSYLKAPDLLIYLKADLNTLVNQIKQRGRDFEKNIDNNYIEKLNVSYDIWINNYNHGKTLTIESDELDFVNSKNDLDYVIKLVLDKLDD